MPDTREPATGDIGMAPWVDGPQRARLRFQVDRTGRTYVGEQFASHPFHWCKPFQLTGDPQAFSTIYIQSCSGGLFQGDDLALRIDADAGARAHVTTAASTIVHDMPNGLARQHVTFRVGADAVVEYLPDAAILFPDAELESRLDATIEPGAAFLFQDAILLHDPDDGNRPFRRLSVDLAIRGQDGSVWFRDRYRIPGRLVAEGIPGITGTFRAQGGFVAISERIDLDAVLNDMRKVGAGSGDLAVGASSLPGGRGVCARVLARDAAALRAALHSLWAVAREATTGTTAIARRK